MNKDELTSTLTKNNRQRDNDVESKNLSFSRKEYAYERLKVLYGVSKIISSLDNIEKAFPEVLAMCSATFPFLTVTMIENRGKDLKTLVWNSDNADQEHIDLAIMNAKESFIYLTGASASDSANLRTADVYSKELSGIRTAEKVFTKKENYCVIPLLVDRLPAFGILQIEGSLGLTENDLEFVGALGDLISISLDRYHKTKFELELRQKEAAESSIKLSRSAAHVLNLETERELREKFVFLLTHDLRTPLSAIKMNSQLIERNYENALAVRSYAVRIDASVNRADQMISDLLDANLIRSGDRLPINIDFFDLTSLIQKTLAELSVIHNNRFILNASDAIQGYWDFRGIRRIVENLCNNAVKYGAPDTQITINLFEKAESAIIEVCNKGEIISDQDQKFLFQQFRGGRKKSAVKGWGIGLTLVRGVAEAHGGKVKVKSEVETGTIFVVTLPLDARPFILH
jgi:signal transduction histidine kinase